MTEFGKQYLPHWIRGRILLSGLALLLVLAIVWTSPAPLVWDLFFILLVNVGLSVAFYLFITHLTVILVYLAFVIDILGIALVIQYTDGIAGGFAAAYIVIALNCILLLGRRSFARVALMILIAVGAQAGLEAFGVLQRSPALPTNIIFAGQVLLLGTLLYTTYLVSRTSSTFLTRWRDEKQDAELERAAAEKEQQRWALINNVALRIQESTTPQQVYLSIGEELEGIGLHCTILEWAEPNVSMRSAYNSLPRVIQDALQKQLRLESSELLYTLDAQPNLAQVIATRETRWLQAPTAGILALFPKLDSSTLTQLLTQYKITRLVLAPMIVHDEVVGILAVFGEEITAQDLKPFAALAQQAASALDKARSLTEQRKRNAQLELASRIATQVSSAENAEQIIQPLVRQIGEQFGYDVVSILLHDAPRDELYVAAHYSLLNAAMSPKTRQPLTRGIVGLVARTGEMYLARDTRLDPNYHSPRAMPQTLGALTPLAERDPIRSELALPLRAHTKVIGVLDLESSQPDAFDANDLYALTLLAEQASAALNKTHTLALEQRRAAQLALVSEIAARAAAFSDPETIVRTMVELVQERFGYHHVCVSLYDLVRNELEQRYAAGPNAHLYVVGNRWSANVGLIGLAARTRQTVYSSDLFADPRYAPDPDRVANSALCVPLVSGKSVLGVLDILSKELNAFDANDIGAMETLANQMSAALEKARSLQTERRRAAQMALVNRIASRTARLIPAEQLMRDAVEMIRTQFGYFNVAILLRDQIQPGVRLIANAGGLTKLLGGKTEYLTGGIIGYVDATGNTYYCPDPTQDPRYVSPFASPADDSVRSELTIPLRRGETVLGVLDIQSEVAAAFPPGDITALEALTDQLAAGLENARLYELEQERAAQLEAVRVLSLKLTAERDAREILTSILASAVELVQADGSTLYIVDEARGDIVVQLSNRLARNFVGFRLKLGEGLAGRVAARGEPLVVEDYEQWEGRVAVYANDNFARIMSVPLKWQDRVLGVINLHRKREHPLFNQEELRFANLFAAQAAIALENARLVDALQTRLRELNLLFEGYRATASTLEPDQVLARLMEQLVRALNVTSAYFLRADTVRQTLTQTHQYFSEQANAQERIQEQVTWRMQDVPEIRAILMRQVPVTHDTDADLPPNMRAYMEHKQVKTILRVPLVTGEEIIGYVSLWETRFPRAWSEQDIRFVQTMSSQAAATLLNAQLYQAAQSRTRELQTLYEASRTLNSTLDVQEICEYSVDALRDLLGYHHVSIYFVEDATLRLQVQRGYADPLDNIPLTRGVMARAVQTREITFLPDVREEPTFLAALTDTQSEIAVPLLTGEHALGVLNVETIRNDRATPQKEFLTSADVQLLSTFANQLVIAIQNARLFQQTQTALAQVRTLHAASQAVNADLKLDKVLERVAQQFLDALQVDSCTISRVDLAQNEMITLLDFEPVEELHVAPGTRFPLTVPTDQLLLHSTGQAHAFHIDDFNLRPTTRNVMNEFKWLTLVVAPLVVRGELVGYVELGERKQIRSFDANELKFVESLANQAALAIQNANLFQETQFSLVQVQTLHAASQAVNSDLELDAVLERVAEQFVKALGVDSCTILDWDQEHDETIVLFDYDTRQEFHLPIGTRERADKTPGLREIWNAPETRHLRSDDPALPPLEQQHMERYAWKSVTLVPLLSKGAILGVIELGARENVRQFDSADMRLIESLASQAAVALENARLYRDAQTRLQETETLYRFARELGGTLDIQELGKRALEAAARLTDFDAGEVSLRREDDGALVPLVFTGNVEVTPDERILPKGFGIMGWVVEHGRAARVGDVSRDPRYRAISPYIMSELCLPLVVGKRVIGALNLEAKAPNAFDAHAEELLTVFANQLAITIENVRLYEQTKQDADVKAALLRELSHRVKNNLAAITSLLYLALDEPPEAREQILSETLGRVQSMSLAHALLARSSDARVNVVELGRQVLNDTVRNLARPGMPIQVHVSGDIALVGARQTTTLALVLNELATNSVRHGFAQPPTTLIPMLRFNVTLRRDEIICELQDNGAGLPDAFELEQNAGLGLNLVRTLVEKDLHGQFALTQREEWSCAEMRFRVTEM